MPSEEIRKKGRGQLTMADRRTIESMLRKQATISDIAAELGRSWATVRNEIVSHAVGESRHFRKYEKNLCIHARTCVKDDLCGISGCRGTCSACHSANCNLICPDFVPVGKCPALKTAPYCCNGCKRVATIGCRWENLYYDADEAQRDHDWRKVASRAGVDCTEEELVALVGLVKPLMKKGQSLDHIWKTHYPGEIPVSKRTFYRYIDLGVLDIANLDLPKKVRYKKRRRSAPKEVPFRPNLQGRTYEDFRALDADDQASAVEMDCVESGRKGSGVLLTLYFRRSCAQLLIYLEHHTQEDVAAALDRLERMVGPKEFARTFPVILTDRGHEFIDFGKIERSCGSRGGARCRVYYCDPLRSGQKGACEKNHVLVRRIFPKGCDLGDYTEEEISVACSHINSYKRPALGGLAPIDLAERMLPGKLLEGLGIRRVDPDDVIMRPSIFRELGMRE